MPITLSQIRQVIKEEINPINGRLDTIDKRLDGVDKRLGGVDKRLDGVDKRLGGVDKRLDGVDKRLGGVEKTIRKNHKEVKLWFNSLDKERFQQDQRLSMLEAHLKLPTPKFDPKDIKIFINPYQ